jgi:hypothetical protein
LTSTPALIASAIVDANFDGVIGRDALICHRAVRITVR